MHEVRHKGSVYHRLVVDANTNEMICICGEPKCDSSGAPRKKFHNRSSEYNGIIYDSALEMRYAVDLDWRLKAKDIGAWKRQVTISFDVCPKCARLVGTIGGATKKCMDHPQERLFHLTNYRVDFVVTHNNGDIEFVECKGVVLGEWRMKWAMMEAVFGNRDDIKLTVVKESKNQNFRRGY